MKPSLLTPLAKNHLGPVAQKPDRAICQTNLYLLDSDLSSGCTIQLLSDWGLLEKGDEQAGGDGSNIGWSTGQVKAQDRVEWRHLILALCPSLDKEGEWVSEWASEWVGGWMGEWVREGGRERACLCKCPYLFTMAIIDATLLICCLQLILAMCQLVQPVKMLMMMMCQVGATWGCGHQFLAFHPKKTGTCYRGLAMGGGGGAWGPMLLIWILKRLVSVSLNASRRCQKLNKNPLSLSEFKKRGMAMRCKETITVSQLTFRVSNTYTLPFTINTIHRGVHWSLLTRDILYTNKLAKPPFFFTFSQLCHHCRNLAEGSCLLTQFHFTLCRYFLGHVACHI